jgi:transposase
MFHCRHTTMQLMVQIITLVNQGYPIVAIEAAFGIQARTARDWVGAAERQSGTLQQHLVQQPRELSQVQADELGVPAV